MTNPRALRFTPSSRAESEEHRVWLGWAARPLQDEVSRLCLCLNLICMEKMQSSVDIFSMEDKEQLHYSERDVSGDIHETRF
ncbi:hypothetical protein NDU88_005981 [Pleurodeles waltl]|uniref:Uncharacterized protein n=1 Tax=Pleurodeles waltl TaxID=8319 RepID=A0AAV7X070_PLEWA|nr:hypothetical protein NDU88_005981 [Pleurodeles waltl]